MAQRKNTPDARQRAVAAVKLGATYERAAASAGVAYETLRVWMRDDAAFSADIKAAEAKAAEEALAAIRKAARGGQWQAAAWLLERRYPGEYGRTVQEHRGQQQLTVIYKRDWRGRGESGDDEHEEHEEMTPDATGSS